MDRQYYDNNEIEIDLIDLCREFLKNIKWIALAAVIGLVLGVGFTALRKTPTSKSIEEKREELLENLSDKERQDIEALYHSYTALQNSIESSRKQLSVYEAETPDITEFDDQVLKENVYIYDSDVFGMPDLINFILTADDFKQISEIMYGSTDFAENAFRRVSLKAANDSRNFWNGTADVTDGLEPSTIFVTSVYADNRETADQVLDYVEERIRAKQAQYADKEASFTFEKLDEHYIEQTAEILSKLNTNSDTLTRNIYNFETQLNGLNNNYISKLTGDSKTYYQIISGTYEEAAAYGKNYKKFGLLGLLLGLFAALGWICVKYVLSNTVKTASELRWLMKGDMPYDLSVKGKKAPDSNAVTLIAEDILIREKRDDVKKLYVITEGKAGEDARLKEVLAQLSAGKPVKSGNPLVSSEELRELSESDSAVIALNLKQTKRDDIAKLEQYCRNYNVKILGVIAL